MIKGKLSKTKLQKPHWLIAHYRYVVEHKKKVTIISALIGAGLACLLLIFSAYTQLYPYTITADDQELCYVRSKESAEEVMNKIVKQYVPEGTVVKAVDAEGRIKISKAKSFNVANKNVVTIDEAVSLVCEKFKDKDSDFPTITIASTKIEREKFTPEPKYKKNDNMLAGDSKVKKKGKKGVRDVTKIYTSVNGKVVAVEDSAYKVVKAGTPAVIYKGTLGLPDGKNWKTYTGDPIFKDGAELVKTAKQYLGAPYRYGGKSLTHGIDCVAFVVQMYKKYGINLPYSHSGIQHRGKGVSLKNAKKGDIICYNGHMAIYIGNNKIVEAVRGGVRVKTGASYRKIKTIRRIVE